MGVLLALKTVVMAAGVYGIVRAVYRRVGRRAERGALDPAVTRGLRFGSIVLTGFLLGTTCFLLPLRFSMGWPPWVGKAGFMLAAGSFVIALPLAAWLGWHVVNEEVTGAPHGDSVDGIDPDRAA